MVLSRLEAIAWYRPSQYAFQGSFQSVTPGRPRTFAQPVASQKVYVFGAPIAGILLIFIFIADIFFRFLRRVDLHAAKVEPYKCAGLCFAYRTGVARGNCLRTLTTDAGVTARYASKQI